MLGLGSAISRSGKLGPSIIRDGLVLRHDYNAGAVEPCSTGAASFNGTSDHIDVGDSNNFVTGNNVTMACWFRLLDDDGGQYLISNQRSSAIAVIYPYVLTAIARLLRLATYHYCFGVVQM